MGLTGGAATVKYLLFIFNLIFWISGIVFLSVGIAIKQVYDSYDEFLDNGFLSLPSLLIAVGVIVFIVSFFGCCGAVRENHCMIITFSLLLLFIFILELSGGIAGYVLRNRTVEVLSEKLNSTMYKYNMTDEVQITETWDNMQREFECCGIHNYTDWDKLNFTGQLPFSCCKSHTGSCNNSTLANVNTEGCLTALCSLVSDNAVTLGGVGLGIAFVEILGVVFACMLARAIRQQYESV